MLALMTVAKRKLNIDHTSALEVFLNDMRYINPRFTLLYFTYLLTLLTYAHSFSSPQKFDRKNIEKTRLN